MSQPPRHILALDQGTTSSRAIIFDANCRIVASAQKEFRQIYPKPGWVEHDPMDIWSSQRQTMAEAIAEAQLHADDIAGIGVTNQRETTLVWDRESGKPVYNAIVWQDRRTSDLCAQLAKDGFAELVHCRAGLRLDPYFSGTKLRWILDNVDGAMQRAERGQLLFGTIDSWLIWKLTGGKVHVTDVTNASRTLMMNLHTCEWDDDLLEMLQIPRAMLPEICSSAEIYGEVAGNLMAAGRPIAGIAGDQQAALFGQACFKPGMIKNTYGTGCFMLMTTGSEPIPSRNNLLTTVAWRIGKETVYALEGSVFIGGAVIQWLRDELGLVQTAQEVDRIAAGVSDSHGVFIVPAFTGLGAPHWDPHARGTIVGITRGTNRAHLCRAALESIALQCADLISCMEGDSGLKLRELRVDGGASRSEPLLQFQADLLQAPVVRPANIETTAMGAAFLAGLALGVWSSTEAIAELWKSDRKFVRVRDETEIRKLLKRWDQALRCAKECGNLEFL